MCRHAQLGETLFQGCGLRHDITRVESLEQENNFCEFIGKCRDGNLSEYSDIIYLKTNTIKLYDVSYFKVILVMQSRMASLLSFFLRNDKMNESCCQGTSPDLNMCISPDVVIVNFHLQMPLRH